jgi:hypothetical protein
VIKLCCGDLQILTFPPAGPQNSYIFRFSIYFSYFFLLFFPLPSDFLLFSPQGLKLLHYYKLLPSNNLHIRTLKEPIERKEFEFSPPAPITRVVNSTQALPEVRLVALDQA